jgi:hypothetical protein
MKPIKKLKLTEAELNQLCLILDTKIARLTNDNTWLKKSDKEKKLHRSEMNLLKKVFYQLI